MSHSTGRGEIPYVAGVLCCVTSDKYIARRCTNYGSSSSTSFGVPLRTHSEIILAFTCGLRSFDLPEGFSVLDSQMIKIATSRAKKT